ncbi:MAG: tricarballylate utilization protein TcuB, partial [Betaproteobacteria bacterium]
MPPIDALVREAAALANGGAPAPGDVNADALNVDEAEVGRQMHICNACRYCEGFC